MLTDSPPSPAAPRVLAPPTCLAQEWGRGELSREALVFSGERSPAKGRRVTVRLREGLSSPRARPPVPGQPQAARACRGLRLAGAAVSAHRRFLALK